MYIRPRRSRCAILGDVDSNWTECQSSTSGCEQSDFQDFPVGNIAVLQRGTCYFGTKVAMQKMRER